MIAFRTAVRIHLNWRLSYVDFGWQKTSIRRESLGLIWQTNGMEMPLSPLDFARRARRLYGDREGNLTGKLLYSTVTSAM